MSFCPRIPSGSLEILKIKIPTTLGANNFVCRPPIEMGKVVAFIESFPMVCGTSPACKEIEAIFGF